MTQQPGDYISGHLRAGGHSPGGIRGSVDVRVEQHRLPTTYTEFARLAEADAEETAQAVQVLARWGHAVDTGEPELLALVFGSDAIIDEEAAEEPRPAHHTVNTEVRRDGERLVAWSRLLTIAGDGSVASADQLDVLGRTAGGWRVLRRIVHPRHGGVARIGDGDIPWR